MPNPKHDKHYLPNKAPLILGVRKVGQVVNHHGLNLEFLGRGRFTIAFRAVRNVYLYTFHEDFSKSIMSQAYAKYGDINPHLARIERLRQEIMPNGMTANVYKARYYRPITKDTKLTSRNRELIDRLQELHENACEKFRGDVVRSYKSAEFNEFIIHGKGLGYSLKMALEHLAFAAEDWGDHYIFDSFKLQNLGLDSTGNLILIDPMFDMEKIQRDHDSRNRRNTYDTTT